MPYSDVAQAYADNVRVLFKPTSGLKERGTGRGPLSDSDVIDRAETLVPISDRLEVEASKKLAADDPAERTEASEQLLAKALTDITVSAYLLEAAEDAEVQNVSQRAERSERSITFGAPEDLLQIIVGGTRTASSRHERSMRKALSIPEYRETLSQTIDDTIDLISRRTATAGQAALTGLFGIGLTEVGQAAGVVGKSIAEAFGQVDRLSRLYELVRTFAHKAYESVLALLGPVVAKVVGQQVLEWLVEVKEAQFFGNLLERLYQTKQTQAALLVIVEASEAHNENFESAVSEVGQLGQQCGRQTALVEKLLKGLKYLGAIPAAVLPYGTLLLAAAYIAILAYLVFNGADYLDADRLKILNRVRGIRQVVEGNLATA